MNTLCLPTSMWHGAREACATLVQRVAERSAEDPIAFVVDRESILRQVPNAETEQTFVKLGFREWLKPGAIDEDVIDIERIRSMCRKLPGGAVVVIDASGYKTEVIVRALFQARIGLHSRADWPRVWALVCDDSQIFQIASPLANAFYIQPAIIAPAAIQRIVNRLAKDGQSLRMFGHDLGSFAVFARRWRKRRADKQERKAARALGWVWEE
ncbi:hypothetical protein PQQ63_26985 [Paraburkholderia metrosideri]|uniref:Uncharacterized protein n=1 Tax=Paraburkholderia metrosideri TaxID=580937 RepID=A0ABW9DYC3_9BURK